MAYHKPMDVLVLEIAERTRRIETRVTKFLEAQGFDTKVTRPTFVDGVVDIPSLSLSILDMLKVVPLDWPHEDEIDITHKGTLVMSIYVPPVAVEGG